MKKKSKKIIFFGTEDFSATILESFINDGCYPIAAVITKPDSRRGRGKKLCEPVVKRLAKKHGIVVWQPDNLLDITDDINNVDDRLGVLVSYGKIIPKTILDLFEPVGIINLHPSMLPKYRGPSPVEAAILSGDTKIGLSFMKLVEKMDAGPVYSQSEIQLNNKEGALEVYRVISKVASEEFPKILTKITQGKIVAKPQNEAEAIYSKLTMKSDGVVDWNKPAKQLEREVRAYQIWPRSLCTIGKVEAIIKEAQLGKDIDSKKIGDISLTGSSMAFQTSDGSLVINRIQPLGRREMSTREFIAGYRDKI